MSKSNAAVAAFVYTCTPEHYEMTVGVKHPGYSTGVCDTVKMWSDAYIFKGRGLAFPFGRRAWHHALEAEKRSMDILMGAI